jgi:hypothetical protein
MRPAAITNPEDVRVIVPLRISWKGRELLRQHSAETGLSINQILLTALDVYGIDALS